MNQEFMSNISVLQAIGLESSIRSDVAKFLAEKELITSNDLQDLSEASKMQSNSRTV